MVHHIHQKQLFVSILWILFGICSLVLAATLRSVLSITLAPEDDALANFEPIARTTFRVIGGVFICLGIIPLVTQRRPIGVLVVILSGALAGAFFAVLVVAILPGEFNAKNATVYHEAVKNAIAYGCIALGAIISLLASKRTDTPSALPPG